MGSNTMPMGFRNVIRMRPDEVGRLADLSSPSSWWLEGGRGLRPPLGPPTLEVIMELLPSYEFRVEMPEAGCVAG